MPTVALVMDVDVRPTLERDFTGVEVHGASKSTAGEGEDQGAELGHGGLAEDSCQPVPPRSTVKSPCEPPCSLDARVTLLL